MIPPRSPWSLIQEDLWPDEWKILISCILLNRTTRKHVEPVLPVLFQKYPDARAMSCASHSELSNIIAPLGFKNRRAETLIKMSKHYLDKKWSHAKELPGIGEYGAAAWEMFCLQKIPHECPKDGALTRVWNWRKNSSLL
jgi:methyl-CpG-binding domain protein 4